MEGRLNKQQAVLGRLEEKIREEREYSDKVDVQIQEAVQRIHTLLDQKVTAEELETLRCKMDQMEAYIKVGGHAVARKHIR